MEHFARRYHATTSDTAASAVTCGLSKVGCALVLMIGGLPAGALAEPPDLRPTPRPHELEQTWVELDGTTYGAQPGSHGPIGGGDGYARIITEGDYHVSTRPELIEALSEAQAGEVVFVDPDAEIDLSVWVRLDELTLEVPGGVTLASNRGQDGAAGAIIYSDEFATQRMIRTTGPGVRITGLRLRGPDPQRRMDLHRAAFQEGGGRELYYSFPTSRGVETRHAGLEVDNCEVWGWSHAGIYLVEGEDHRIHYNHIHHNQRHGLGYGVTINKAQAEIEYNLFDWNRHSIAATGRPPSGYAARHNVVLENANSHLLDMHGGRDRGDGTDIAGSWMAFENNTLINTQQSAIVIRGVPEQEAVVERNWFHHPEEGDRAVRTGGRTNVADNVYGVPPRTETTRP